MTRRKRRRSSAWTSRPARRSGAEPGFGSGGVIIADGKLIALSGTGELLIAPATPEGFKPTTRAQVLGAEMLDGAGAGQWVHLLPQFPRRIVAVGRCARSKRRAVGTTSSSNRS